MSAYQDVPRGCAVEGTFANRKLFHSARICTGCHLKWINVGVKRGLSHHNREKGMGGKQTYADEWFPCVPSTPE